MNSGIFKGSSSRLRSFPFSLMTSIFNSSATASIRPVPHIPMAFAFPIVFTSIPDSFITIFSIAPSLALIPWVIRAPSKAGPAAVEQEMSLSLFPMTSSPLVPISMANFISSPLCISEARITATVSPPTKPAIFGIAYILPYVFTFTPRNFALLSIFDRITPT